jgi:hypothetical protein
LMETRWSLRQCPSFWYNKKTEPENKYRKEKRNQKWKKLLRIRREKDSKRRRRK